MIFKKNIFSVLSGLCSLLFFISVLGVAPTPTHAIDGEVTYNASDTGLNGDDEATDDPVDFGFTFNFYGTDYTSAYVSTNGMLNFTEPYTEYSEAPLASGGTDNSLYTFWDDLTTNSENSVYYKTIGTAPNRKFVTQWTNMYFYGTSIEMGTFQAILYEGTNVVQFQYRNLLGSDRALGNSATVGIKKDNTTNSQYSYDTKSLTEGQAISYTPDGEGGYSVNSSATYDPVYLVLPGAPQTPALISPTNGAINTSLTPTFTWTESATSSMSYRLLVSTDSNFSNTVIAQSDIATTTYTPTDALDPDTTYYWRVKASNDIGSSLSSANSFTTHRVLITSTLSPSDHAFGVATGTDLSLTFATSSVSTSTGDIKLYKSSDDALIESFPITSARLTRSQTSSTTVFTIDPTSALLDSTKYYVSVASTTFKDGTDIFYGGTTGKTAWDFTTLDPVPPAVSLTIPTASSTVGGSAVSLKATSTDNLAVGGVTFYYDSTNKIGSEVTATSPAGTYSTTWNTSSLSSGTHTLFAVARDTSNNYATSTAISVTVDNNAPVISSITSSVLSTGATFTWNTNKAASTKVVYAADNSYASSTSETDINTRVTSHSTSITGLLSCTLYHYKVVSVDSGNNVATSTENSFTTSGCKGDATPSAATSTKITVATKATSILSDSGHTLTVVTPANVTATSSSLIIQVKGLPSDTVLGSIGNPSGLTSGATIVFDVTALLNNSTVLDSFDHPVTITYHYTDTDISGLNESSLALYHYHNSAWVKLDDCFVDTNANNITCTTPSFSVFGLFGTAVNNSNSSGGSEGGTSIQGQVKNLTMLGKTAEADALKAKWQTLFPVATVTPALTVAQLEQKLASLIALNRQLFLEAHEKGIVLPKSILDTLDIGTTTVNALPIRDLQKGMKGDDVQQLQELLIEEKSGSSATELARVGATGFFGTYTVNALGEYQRVHDILPHTGYFGELTRTQMKQAGLDGLWW